MAETAPDDLEGFYSGDREALTNVYRCYVGRVESAVSPLGHARKAGARAPSALSVMRTAVVSVPSALSVMRTAVVSVPSALSVMRGRPL